MCAPAPDSFQSDRMIPKFVISPNCVFIAGNSLQFSSLFKTQTTHFVQCYWTTKFTGGDFKSTFHALQPNPPRVFTQEQMIKVLTNLWYCTPAQSQLCSSADFLDMDILPHVLSSKLNLGMCPVKCLLLLGLWTAKWQLYNQCVKGCFSNQSLQQKCLMVACNIYCTYL